MVIQIPQTGVIKKQRFDISNDVSIIYGYNNCGKTTILKALDDVFRNRLMEKFILDQTGEIDKSRCVSYFSTDPKTEGCRNLREQIPFFIYSCGYYFLDV
ncbi:MAG: ATP-binding protein [Lachnospiraceae bacterium]|nr:ATP-binding protein [Lachnospiraceae bacterium]